MGNRKYTGPGGGDEPRYLNVDEDLPVDQSHTFINLTPYPDGAEGVTFTVNPDAMPVASATWGEVKALYR